MYTITIIKSIYYTKDEFSCLTRRIESHVVVEKNFDNEEELIKHSQIK